MGKEVLPEVQMHITRGFLVVPAQGELHDEFVLQMQHDILTKLYTSGVKGLIIDVSGVNVIDSFIAHAIFDIAKMAALLGAKTAVTGIRPGVAASLIDLDFEPDYDHLFTAINLEEGFRILESIAPAREELTEDEEEIVPKEGPEMSTDLETGRSEDAEK